ncbi:MAG: DUF4347 domain-containing protein [Bacteroidales bacterium]|nr:DUF4347 domain-containing protein [Bacteroidales bacterium]
MMLFVYISFGMFSNDVKAQNKLVAVVPPATYDINLISGNSTEQFSFIIPVDERSFGSIADKLETKNYDELHIFTATEADKIIFHNFSLTLSSLNDHAAMLSKFKAFSVRIIFHSDILGKGDNGKRFIETLSNYMGNTVEVQN